ncbi:DUF4363 family protein [Garciella nitratireducens]|uniref:DUF4363 family protein n=1 Tax=Garciella nitratireducens TaxID=218205 RepID=UPI000E033D4F|nr:DUF4363 family protein [Garciella nitratireducens]RBP39543.1 uncharacterized protein DUF4363 [Garciella nitratireducens]
MKIFWISLLIILIFLSFTVYLNICLEKSSQEVMNILEEIEKNINQQDWELAKNNLDKLINKWEKMYGPWQIIMEHQELDNIELSLLKMTEYIKVENEDLAKAELASLKFLIRHIYTNNVISIENIF